MAARRQSRLPRIEKREQYRFLRAFGDLDAGGTRWVIDFKTSRHEGGRLEEFIGQELERYRGQLEVYATLARGLGPQPVRAALYFPLLGVFREFQ